MTLRPLMVAATIAAGMSGTAAMVASPAHAQGAVEAEIVGFHQLCQQGDRKACIRFGMLLGGAKERHADWRRAHAEWWWWEH